MRKQIAAAALAASTIVPGVALAQAKSDHSFSANVGLFSEYIFRGTAQTAGEAALQGGFDYSHSSGLYAGTWASNVSWLEDFRAYTRSSMEWDFYGGYKGSFGSSDFTYDLGTIYYYYPGNANPGVVKADTWEIYAGLGWKYFGIKYSYNLKDYFGARPTGGKTDGTWYLDFSVDYPIGETGFSVNAHYGILDVDNDGTRAAATEASYNDWKIGAKYTVASGLFKDLALGVYYTDTDVKKNAAGASWWVDTTGYDTAKSAFVAYVSKSF